MIKGLNLDATRTVTSRYDDASDEHDKTKFTIGTLDSRVLGRIRDSGTTYQVDPNRPDDEVSTAVNTNDVNAQIVAYGLKGFSNFRDQRGDDIAFETETRRHSGASYQVVKPHVLAQIPLAVITELAELIIADNELSAKAGNA